MIYGIKITKKRNTLIEQAYTEGMRELNEFFGIKWVRNTPNIYIVSSRREIDYLQGQKTEPWVTGWVNGWRDIYMLAQDKRATESNHTDNDDKFLPPVLNMNFAIISSDFMLTD
jgi:hypothetical protein